MGNRILDGDGIAVAVDHRPAIVAAHGHAVADDPHEVIAFDREDRGLTGVALFGGRQYLHRLTDTVEHLGHRVTNSARVRG